ncbi:MAG: hypothetical protein PHT33_14550 [bacterium]|nr:hypothetical protein [bacterium]
MNATDHIRQAVEKIATEYPAGCLSWAAENRPDLMRQYSGAVKAVDQTYRDKDQEQFMAAMQAYTKAGQALCRAYSETGQAHQLSLAG